MAANLGKIKVILLFNFENGMLCVPGLQKSSVLPVLDRFLSLKTSTGSKKIGP